MFRGGWLMFSKHSFSLSSQTKQPNRTNEKEIFLWLWDGTTRLKARVGWTTLKTQKCSYFFSSWIAPNAIFPSQRRTIQFIFQACGTGNPPAWTAYCCTKNEARTSNLHTHVQGSNWKLEWKWIFFFVSKCSQRKRFLFFDQIGSFCSIASFYSTQGITYYPTKNSHLRTQID